MKIKCESGFYKFLPENQLELQVLQKKYGYVLIYTRGFWTFKELAELQNYSFTGHHLTGVNFGTTNYAGKPEDVLKKNNLTYNLKLGTITPKVAILTYLKYDKGAFITTKELPQAFGFDKDGQKISGFEGFLNVALGLFKIERFFYENI